MSMTSQVTALREKGAGTAPLGMLPKVPKKYAVKSESFDQPFAKIRLIIPGQGCECDYC